MLPTIQKITKIRNKNFSNDVYNLFIFLSDGSCWKKDYWTSYSGEWEVGDRVIVNASPGTTYGILINHTLALTPYYDKADWFCDYSP